MGEIEEIFSDIELKRVRRTTDVFSDGEKNYNITFFYENQPSQVNLEIYPNYIKSLELMTIYKVIDGNDLFNLLESNDIQWVTDPTDPNS